MAKKRKPKKRDPLLAPALMAELRKRLAYVQEKVEEGRRAAKIAGEKIAIMERLVWGKGLKKKPTRT